MQIKKQTKSEYEKDMRELFIRTYKKTLSEAIKRGIRAKKLQK